MTRDNLRKRPTSFWLQDTNVRGWLVVPLELEFTYAPPGFAHLEPGRHTFASDTAGRVTLRAFEKPAASAEPEGEVLGTAVVHGVPAEIRKGDASSPLVITWVEDAMRYTVRVENLSVPRPKLRPN